MNWAYGVTTVPDRFADLLPRTLGSLARAGFDKPRLFIDETAPCPLPLAAAGLPTTHRFPAVRTVANWVLSAWELYLRNPHADRYALFQDDLVAYCNLRTYLEHCDYPHKGYLNLYTFPHNLHPRSGWYLSDQMGRGAVGLVFNNEAMRTLFQQQHLIDKPLDSSAGHSGIDGSISAAMKQAGYFEYVHNPSLVQHTGKYSTMGNSQHLQADSFRGEDFDATALISTLPAVPHRPVSGRTKRVGLVGFNCRSGLGELNRQITTYCHIDRWLVKPHNSYPTLPDHPDVDTFHCPTGAKIEKFLDGIDTVLFCETPYYNNLIEECKKRGKRTVCVPMQEWMPAGCQGWPMDVDLFICPTKHAYDQFAHVVPCAYFPWPVDTLRFPFQERPVCDSFLFLNGHGGYDGRKGKNVICKALEIWPHMPILVRSQQPESWPIQVKFLSGDINENADLYATGSVLVAPHSIDGLGLEPMEAMSCGMPVITTDGRPWNELPAVARIQARVDKRKVRRPVDWYLPLAESLVAACKQLLHNSSKHPTYFQDQCRKARHWAESRAWEAKARMFTDLVRYGVTDGTLESERRAGDVTTA